ncbi:MAG: hypothetical protein OXO48_03580 [Caldilineaceae bacterium]|nr:hypothetical protein [Caldilineaceae bacterium]
MISDTVEVEKNTLDSILSDRSFSTRSQTRFRDSGIQQLDERMLLPTDSCVKGGNIADSIKLNETQTYIQKPRWNSNDPWLVVKDTESVKVISLRDRQGETSENKTRLASAPIASKLYGFFLGVISVGSSDVSGEFRLIQDDELEDAGIAPDSKGLDWQQENVTHALDRLSLNGHKQAALRLRTLIKDCAEDDEMIRPESIQCLTDFFLRNKPRYPGPGIFCDDNGILSIQWSIPQTIDPNDDKTKRPGLLNLDFISEDQIEYIINVDGTYKEQTVRQKEIVTIIKPFLDRLDY